MRPFLILSLCNRSFAGPALARSKPRRDVWPERERAYRKKGFGSQSGVVAPWTPASCSLRVRPLCRALAGQLGGCRRRSAWGRRPAGLATPMPGGRGCAKPYGAVRIAGPWGYIVRPVVATEGWRILGRRRRIYRQSATASEASMRSLAFSGFASSLPFSMSSASSTTRLLTGASCPWLLRMSTTQPFTS